MMALSILRLKIIINMTRFVMYLLTQISFLPVALNCVNNWPFSETAMGSSIDAQSHPESEYVHSVKDMCRIAVERLTDMIKNSDFLFRLTEDYKKQEKAVNILHNYTDKMIKQRKQLKISQSATTNNKEGEAKKKKLGFLDLLLEYNMMDKPLMDETQIRNEVDTIMFAVSLYKSSVSLLN